MLISDLPPCPFTFTRLAECAERELNMRRHVYPNRIMTSRMSRETANAELDMMRHIAEIMRALARTEKLI